MNKKEKEAIKAMRDFEIKLIQIELLTRTRNTNDEYAQFTLDELFAILKPIEKRYQRLKSILSNIDAIVGILMGFAIGSVAADVISESNSISVLLLAIFIDLVIMMILGVASQNVRHRYFQEQSNFLEGKAHIVRDGNIVTVEVDNFKKFTVTL